ncbi:hypothetical protein MRB53_008533 [Persea americana]|uniref:Uncharacterized protein n=1 Tax=Persea americana TaxID=3435 RepID=A0ACC2MMD2_PERAE|nr:hypothetical protein MRB53_008533 [Persea americana]
MSNAASQSTDRRSIISESSPSVAEYAFKVDCDEVMQISSALVRIRGAYASSPALSAPRSVASTGSSVGCTSSSEVSKSNISEHARTSRDSSGKCKSHTRRSSRSDYDLWHFESLAASLSSKFLNKTNEGSMGDSRAALDYSPTIDRGLGGSGNAPLHFLSPCQGRLSISKDVRA